MKILYEKNYKFEKQFKNLTDNRLTYKTSKNIDNITKEIINKIRKGGDQELVRLTKKYDGSKINKNDLLINEKVFRKYKNKIEKKVLSSFKESIKRINKYHLKQYPKSYKIIQNGICLSSRWQPIESVGLYVPGGKASYPSSLIMNIIPAKIAGVKRIVVATPSQKGKFNPYILAILKLFKIKEVYQIGGAQAIAALAFGTKTIKPVNKIFGPGNAYVASAKKQVFGNVGIDLIAGPSEVVVVADKKNNPKWIASDLIAQSEHDELAQSILITDDKKFALYVKKEIYKLIRNLSTYKILKKSIKNNGHIIVVKSMNKVERLINEIAPEHLHLQTTHNKLIYKKIKNAGAVFMGKYSTESLGDYIVGTNHILPTNKTSKFASGLNVLDFMKFNSCIDINHKGFKNLAKKTKKMAEVEGLDGHKLSIQIREDKV